MDIRRDTRNYRVHSKKNKQAIKRSLAECGAGRSIVIDSEGEIIAGNGVYEHEHKHEHKHKHKHNTSDYQSASSNWLNS